VDTAVVDADVGTGFDRQRWTADGSSWPKADERSPL